MKTTTTPDIQPGPSIPSVPVNGQPVTLAEIIDHEAASYRSQGTAIGDFLASQLERLAQLVRWTGATTPVEHEDRMQVWDDDIRQQWFERGMAEAHYNSHRHS